MPIVNKETVEKLRYGWTTAADSPTQLTAQDLPDGNMKGVLIKAPGSADDTPNTEPVYIGGPGVTANSAVATDGFPLTPGDSIVIPLESAASIYVVSESGGQLVAWMLV